MPEQGLVGVAPRVRCLVDMRFNHEDRVEGLLVRSERVLAAGTVLTMVPPDADEVVRVATPEERFGILEYVTKRMKLGEVLAQWDGRIRIFTVGEQVEYLRAETPVPSTAAPQRPPPAWTIRHDF